MLGDFQEAHVKINTRRIELWLIDTAVIAAIFWGTSIISTFDIDSVRFNGEFTVPKFLLMYACVMGVRLFTRIYKNIWRYANVYTYLKLMAADAIGGILFILIGRVNKSLSLGVTGSALIIMLTALATLLTRFLYQVFYAYRNQSSDVKVAGGDDKKAIHKINIAIVGAGNVGATLAEELIRNPKSHYHPYCFIDNDSNKAGNTINGIKVLPASQDIIDQIKAMPIQEIVIAIPDASPEAKQRLYDLYKKTDCKVKIYDYLVSDERSVEGKRMLREFSIEDLLFRDSLNINSDLTRDFYRGKTVLVTGGGGSIGSELSRQIAAMHPKKLVILDIYENNAYDIQQELINKYGDALNLDTIIASVRDVKRLDQVFREVRPDIVFHAAAHKHVPLMERSACEAIKNNVLGTFNTANMAEKYGVKKFLLISTDKAVNPTNVMGASKRLCEMIIQCRTDSKCEFTAVRFGNVLGSNGSVIPLFRKQIEQGGPITLTDRRIIRYFMTIPEAVGLVMETGAMAHNGELFVLDMGKPVKILDLAENMIRLSGLVPDVDIKIEEIGLRPGEKLYEELLMKNEELTKTENELIFIEKDKPLTRAEVDAKIEVLQKAVQTESHEAIVEAIKETVPTFHEPDEVNKNAEKSAEMCQAFDEPASAILP